MNRLFQGAAALWALAAVAGPAQAEYLWLQHEGTQTTVRAGALQEPLAALPALQDARVVGSDGKAVPVQATTAAALAVAPATEGDQRFAATRVREDGVLVYYQARFGRAETRAVNDLELVPTESNGDTFRLFFKGRPVAASRITVETSEGWRRTLMPDADGSVRFTPSFPALYVLDVSARVNNGSVTLNGKRYDEVHHTATLSFEVRR